MVAPQLLRLTLPISDSEKRVLREFDCLGNEQDDPVAQNVCGFLSDFRFLPSLRHNVSATYMLASSDTTPALIGYTTLALDSVRLTNSEKRRMDGISFSDFGALRIQMIGVDHRHQGKGNGGLLLEGITGLARQLSASVSARFLLADANVLKVGWYERAGFVPNQAKREVERVDPERSISMRLDLLEGLRGDEEAAASATQVSAAPPTR